MTERPRWQMAVAAAAVVLLVLAGLRWHERTRGGPAAEMALAEPPAAEGGPAPRRRLVFVHVAGAVRRPGVYSLPRGSRGGDALERAGGPARRADLTAVNLAALLEDGQQLVVPVRGAAGGGAGTTGTAGSAAGGAGAVGGAGKLRLSTATAADLDQLDGIGPALAARILAYRDAHGGFRSVDELGEVDGIGAKRLESLREAVVP